MKSMRVRQWAYRGVSSCLLMAIILTYSMVTLAVPSKPVGELTFSGSNADQFVTVNGEAAKSGRTLFGDSTIATGEGVQAVINISGGGKIQLAPNSKFVLSPDGTFAGSLIAGNVKARSRTEGLAVKISAGDLVKLDFGDSVDANSSTVVKQTKAGGLEPWQWALIIGAAAAVIIIVAASGGNDSTPISPIR